MANRVIVSRHPAAVEFIRRELPEFADAPVLATATAEDVAGKDVAGNLPLELAALANVVFAVCFPNGNAPRGSEYGIEEMDAAGATIRAFRVQAIRYAARCACLSVPTESGYVEDCGYYDAHVADTPFVPMCASQRCVELE
jgi:hypothetical protein